MPGVPRCRARRESSARSRHRPSIPTRPLAWLRRRVDAEGRPLICDEQYAAGKRLRRDFWIAGMTPRVTASWSGIAQSRSERRGPPGAHVDLPDRIVAARERAIRALVAVGLPHIDMLIDVLGHLKGLEEVERAHALPARSGKRFLGHALTLLAYHYGLLRRPDVEATVRSRMRHWGAEDYRPLIKPPGSIEDI
jgi:hypothetical protein